MSWGNKLKEKEAKGLGMRMCLTEEDAPSEAVNLLFSVLLSPNLSHAHTPFKRRRPTAPTLDMPKSMVPLCMAHPKLDRYLYVPCDMSSTSTTFLFIRLFIRSHSPWCPNMIHVQLSLSLVKSFFHMKLISLHNEQMR